MGNKPQFKVPVIKGDLKKALNKWKRKWEEFGIKDELVDRRYYTKPTTKRRLIKETAIRENKRLVKEQKENE